MTGSTTPSDTAPDQVARLLALVPYLLARGEVRLDEAAAHFGTDSAQLERDLRVLFMTGLSPGLPGDLIEVDIEALEGERVIRVDNADYLARPVRFAPSEATALVVALRTMLDVASPEAAEVVQRTLAKLEGAIGGEESARQLHVQSQPSRAAEIVPVIQGAIARGHQLDLTYHVASRDEVSTRVVDPRAIAGVEDALYLDAWCHRAGDDRVFRLDRIVSVTELDTPVLDPTARARDLTQGWFTDADTTRVTLRVEPAARWMTEYYPVEGARPGPGETLDVDLQVSSEAWLRHLVLRLAPHARIVDPPELADAVLRSARATVDTYERWSGTSA